MKFLPLIFLIIPGIIFQSYGQSSYIIEQNEVLEWTYLSSVDYSNPFFDISLFAEIEDPDGDVLRLPAFWAGNKSWSFRFSADREGEYSFKTICSDKTNAALHNNKGTIQVKKNSGGNPLLKHGPIRIHKDYRYLEHQDGTPFLWLADSWWHGMTKRFTWPEDFKILAADRKKKGFSVIQFAIGFPCDIHPFDPRGQNEAGDPWDSTLTSINPAYFDLADQRIFWLIKEGLLPNIVGAWGYYIKWLGVEKMQKHWEYIIARYGAYPVTWTLCGESTLAWYDDLGTNWESERHIFREKWSEVARYIQENDPFNRILTVHPGPGTFDGKPPVYDMDQIDMVMLQSGHDGFFTIPRAAEAVPETLKKYPGKPVMHGEVCFEGMKGSSWEDVQRILFWSNMLQGTCGFSYGVEGIWQFNTEEELFGKSPGGNTWGNVPWEKAYRYSGSEQVGIGKKILEHFEWWKLQPDQEFVDYDNRDAYGPYSARIDQEIFMIYIQKPPARWRKYTIFGMDPDSRYKLTFYDPLTGAIYDKDDITPEKNGTTVIPQAPISQDWVVVYEKTK